MQCPQSLCLLLCQRLELGPPAATALLLAGGRHQLAEGFVLIVADLRVESARSARKGGKGEVGAMWELNQAGPAGKVERSGPRQKGANSHE